jgi:molybdenum cofactor guanylyltransferase
MPDKNAMRLGAIILAGGRSARMGRAKESLPFRGDTLLGHAIRALASCADRIVVVTRDAAQPLPPLAPGVARTHDAVPGHGPLAGIAAGLRWLGAEGGLGPDDVAFVTACDQPFVHCNIATRLAALLGDDAIVMPRAFGLLQPLCAVYRLSVLPQIEHQLALGADKPHRLADVLATRIVEEAELRHLADDLAFLRNLNTPEDYENAQPRPGSS